jgi:hypothetical protein
MKSVGSDPWQEGAMKNERFIRAILAILVAIAALALPAQAERAPHKPCKETDQCWRVVYHGLRNHGSWQSHQSAIDQFWGAKDIRYERLQKKGEPKPSVPKPPKH